MLKRADKLLQSCRDGPVYLDADKTERLAAVMSVFKRLTFGEAASAWAAVSPIVLTCLATAAHHRAAAGINANDCADALRMLVTRDIITIDHSDFPEVYPASLLDVIGFHYMTQRADGWRDGFMASAAALLPPAAEIGVSVPMAASESTTSEG